MAGEDDELSLGVVGPDQKVSNLERLGEAELVCVAIIPVFELADPFGVAEASTRGSIKLCAAG